MYTIVVLFEGARVSGEGKLEFVLLVTVTLKYDEVALRSVQNVPAVVGAGEGMFTFENPEFAM